MTLKQLYYFQKLAEIQNYTLASQELYISQPSLSYTIRELEKELNTPLFQKSGQGNHICLSRSGKIFLQYINEALRSIEEGKSAVQKQITAEQNVLNIGYLHTTSYSYASKVFQDFPHQPGCELIAIRQKIFSIETELLDELNKGLLNFAFCLTLNDHLDGFPVYEQELFVIVSRKHRLAAHDEISFEDIREEPCIQVPHSDTINSCLADLYRRHGCEPLITAFAGNITVALTYVLSNDCFTIAPVLSTIDFSQLSAVRIRDHTMKRPVYFAWKAHAEFYRQEQLFFDYMCENYRGKEQSPGTQEPADQSPGADGP